MYKYFQAFARQDNSTRNYHNYFKPVLCYIEATWLLSQNLSKLQNNEGGVDARDWEDMEQKVLPINYGGVWLFLAICLFVCLFVCLWFWWIMKYLSTQSDKNIKRYQSSTQENIF